MKQLTLTLQFYRLILFYNIAFTLVCGLLAGFGGGFDVPGLFLAKLAGLCSAIGLYHYSAGKTYFYFRNAGLSIRRVWLYAAAIDILIFALTSTLIITVIHAIKYLKG